jgi:hypothetical protein
MARPRKALPSTDPFIDLSKKTEILEREMAAQRIAIERLQQMSKLRPRPLRVEEDGEPSTEKRRASR